jgi:uncharacterized secreted repeat protein (TIGR03808 family)
VLFRSRADGVAILDNRVTDCALSGIRVNAGSNARISSNEVLRSGETAIYVEFEFQGAVVADNVIDGAANGISVVNFMQGGRLATVSGNLIRNLTSKAPYPNDPPIFGFGITVEADTAVTGNVIEGAPYCGIIAGWGPHLRNLAITGNVIREARIGIIVTVVEKAGEAVIVGNVFQGTKEGAIVGARWTEVVTGDLTVEGARVPAHLTIDRNRVAR